MVSRKDAKGAEVILPFRGRWQLEELAEGAPGAGHTRQLYDRPRSPSTVFDGSPPPMGEDQKPSRSLRLCANP
jgi:hypothetical protein